MLIESAFVIVPFPPDCPPADATPMNGTFYVCAERNLTPGDPTGRMTWQRPYEKKNGAYFGKTDDCDAHSLSVFSELGDIHNARKFTPWMREKSVAAVTVAPSHGVLK